VQFVARFHRVERFLFETGEGLSYRLFPEQAANASK
jgi:hypothetical protein